MRVLRDTDQLGRNEIFVVTEEFKQALQTEYQKVEILMSYEELIVSANNMDKLIGAWDKLQIAEVKYESELDSDYIARLGALKGSCTKASNKLYKEIDRAFGLNHSTAITVYTMLQHGRLQKMVQQSKDYDAKMALLKANGY